MRRAASSPTCCARSPSAPAADAVLVCDMSYYAPGLARRLHRAPRPLLRRDLGPDARARPALRHLWRRRAQRARDAGPDPGASSRTPTARSRSPSSTRRSSRPTKHELKTWKQLPFDKAALPRDEVTGQGPHRAQGVLGPRARLGAAHLRDPRHPGRLRGRWRQDRHSRAGDGEGEPAAGARAELRQGGRSSSSARWRSSRPEWADVEVTLLHGGDPVQVDVDHPAFAVLDEAFEAVTGRPAVRVRAGGSIPIVPELGLAGRAGAAHRHRPARRRAPLPQ